MTSLSLDYGITSPWQKYRQPGSLHFPPCEDPPKPQSQSIGAKKAVQAIFNLPFNSHSKKNFQENFILKVRVTYRFKLYCFLSNTLNENQDSYITQSINALNYIPDHKTCNRLNITIPHFNHSSSQQFFI